MVEARTIGIDVKPPEETCDDDLCPFHGTLPVRGKMFKGVVVKKKMRKTVVVRRRFTKPVRKYKRSERRRGSISARCPTCIRVNEGDEVLVAECRPLSKTVSFVVVESRERK